MLVLTTVRGFLCVQVVIVSRVCLGLSMVTNQRKALCAMGLSRVSMVSMVVFPSRMRVRACTRM